MLLFDISMQLRQRSSTDRENMTKGHTAELLVAAIIMIKLVKNRLDSQR